MARTLYDTAQNASTPAAGKYADLETKVEQLSALVNEHAATLDKLLTPAFLGQSLGTIAKALAGGETAGGLIVCYEKNVADHATQTVAIAVVDASVEVLFAIIQKRSLDAGANANTVQLKKNAAAITDAMSLNGKVDNSVVLVGTIDDEQATLAAGDTLNVTQTKAGGDAAFHILVVCVKR